jgi:hypothetical protein
MPVVRYLEWFDEATRESGCRALEITLEELQELFGIARENPMYDCYEVKPEHIEYLQVCSGQVIDLSRHSYYVSAEST